MPTPVIPRVSVSGEKEEEIEGQTAHLKMTVETVRLLL